VSVASPPRSNRRALRPGEVAWIAAPPCALTILAAIVVLGPPLGHAFLAPGSESLWPREAPYVFGAPDSVKHARYLIALVGPALLAAAMLASARRRVTLREPAIRALVATSQALLVAFVLAAVVGQYRLGLPVGGPAWPIFSVPTLIVAAVLPAVLLAALQRRPALATSIARLVPETRAHRVAGVVVAALYAAAWLLSAVDSDGSAIHAQTANLLPWGMDDPFAVLDGRTPLVDFHAMYAQLWPFPTAAAMAALGATITVYTLVLTVGSGLALLAVYGVLRRIVRSSLLALALFLPIVAAGFMVVPDVNGIGLSNVKIFSMWPLRYAGPYLLAWLTARHLDRAAPRRAWPLFLAAGLVVIDDLEFGIAALAATLVALACARPPRSWRAAARIAAEAASGLAGAALLVSLLTLARAGELPHFAFLLEFPRIFGVLGLAAAPMPALGFHLVLYATFVAAIGVAAVRIAGGERDRLLTGMLAWSGVFGLLAASYYVGRSDRLKLASLFSIWSFALALLVVVVVRGLAARDWRRPGLVELLVLAGFCLAASPLLQTPTPWSQVARLQRTSRKPVFKQPEATRFVAEHTRRGEPVAILIGLGHRIAYDLGITNVAPYSFIEAMVTTRQMQTLLDAIRRAHAHKLFLPDGLVVPEQRAALASAGFAPRAQREGLSEWTDAVAGGFGTGSG
jgi:hypothetical protein